MIVGTNAQNLRACIAWLDLSYRSVAVELGISVSYLRDILCGASLPDDDCKARIANLSTRWPYGVIFIEDWPEPKPRERRGGKR